MTRALTPARRRNSRHPVNALIGVVHTGETDLAQANPKKRAYSRSTTPHKTVLYLMTGDTCMPWKSSENRYSTVTVTLHWLMLILLAVVYACIELRGIFPKGSDGRTLIKEAHFMLGLTVFVLVWLRLFARSMGKAPAIFPVSPAWQTFLAHLMHWALYLFMIAMPLLGWLITSAEGHQVMFYGFDLPLLIDQDKDFAKQLEGWHELGGTIGYWLIGLHALAGLYHHYIVRDNTLLRMMPKRG